MKKNVRLAIKQYVLIISTELTLPSGIKLVKIDENKKLNGSFP